MIPASFIGDVTALVLASQRSVHTAEEVHEKVLRISERHKGELMATLHPSDLDKLRTWAAMAREAVPALPTIADPDLSSRATDAAQDLLHRIAIFLDDLG